MTITKDESGFNLKKIIQVGAGAAAGGIIGCLLGGPVAGFYGMEGGFVFVNTLLQNAEIKAHNEDENKKSNEALENCIRTRETAEKTYWLTCRIIAYTSIAVGSLLTYAKFDINKYSFCTLEQNSYNCSKYMVFSAISSFTALVMPIIGLIDYFGNRSEKKS